MVYIVVKAYRDIQNHFLKRILEHISFFCGATDTPVVDFWLHLQVSKPQWAALFALGGGVCVTCSLRFISGAIPFNLLEVSMAVKLFSSTYLRAGIGGDTQDHWLYGAYRDIWGWEHNHCPYRDIKCHTGIQECNNNVSIDI